ncbi:heptosyltransferase-3 [Dyadobacter jejuensis]|uniref:Heptosyltransferase-3 n=1 Tax=Dyadobacter jejuensis TaxID=1082580 RepID=A0A316ALY5_9BACT|nr:glycosyltransferase family 9 protein [Dyadobacter jejuensis]PWJ58542.1 heptosyltransferase-3 [Dyadobacter jejuensis]
MTIERFKQLWTHRYHKYLHISKAYLHGYQSVFKFWLLQKRLPKGRPLVAIVRTEHFGDIVAAEPISRLVRQRYPHAYVVWFVKPVFRELVEVNAQVDAVFEEFCVTQRKVILGSSVFDRVFELQFKNNNECSKCQVFRDNPVALARNIHVGNYFEYGNLLQVFAQCGGLLERNESFPIDDQPRLALQPRHWQKRDSLGLPQQYMVVHCQSNYAPKDWPAERWNELLAWLLSHYDITIIEIGLRSNLTVTSDRYINLAGQLSILETAAVIEKAIYFIGLDSGPSHLANALGVPGLLLMGALNNFGDYNPYSGGYGDQSNATFIKELGQPCSAMSFDFVRESVRPVLDSALLVGR